jgi:hypothetical protein
MGSATRKRLALLALVPAALLWTAAFPSRTLADDDGDPRIVPLDGRLDDRGYEGWSVAWWHWATAFAPGVNPVLDTDGTYATQGQSGPVFFLAGTFGGTAVRNVSVRRGTYLFLPLANSEWDTVPGFSNPLNLPDPLSVADIRKITSYFVTGDRLSCEIDGKPVRNLTSYRVRSPVFSFNMNPDFATFGGYPAPYVRTAVSDGYWLMLKPLSVGRHVIHFTASNAKTGFAIDVTYNLTITP